MQTNHQHYDQGSSTNCIMHKCILRAARYGFECLIEGHVSLHLCCSFVLTLETLCKELYENICELFRTSGNRGKTSGKLRFAGHVVVASN